MTDRLLTTAEVADRLRKPIATLRYWRSLGQGPRGFRLGRTVVYAEAEVSAWIEEQARSQGAA
jgi:predicted DNA-binding transcriptional regulator AlpA